MTVNGGSKNGAGHDITEHREWLRRFDMQREADAGDPIAQRQLDLEKQEEERQRRILTKAEEYKREQVQRVQALQQLDARVNQHLENWMPVVGASCERLKPCRSAMP